MAAFTNAELVAIRKFCGFGAKTQAGLVMDGPYGNLEFRLGNLDDDEAAEIRTNYLVNLPLLETAIFDAGDNLDTAAAAIWTHSKTEVADRRELYNMTRRELCGFIGVQPGPALSSGRLVRC